MIEDLLTKTQEEFGLLDEPPVVYYTVKTNTGLVVQGVIKQYFNQGIMTLEGTGNNTVCLPMSRYDWTRLDQDTSGYTGPLQFVEATQPDDLVGESSQAYAYKLIMHEFGQCIRVYMPEDKRDMFYNTVLLVIPSVVEISNNVFRCDGYSTPIQVKNFINTNDDCYIL